MRLVRTFLVAATLVAAFALVGAAGHSATTTQAWPIWCCYPEH